MRGRLFEVIASVIAFFSVWDSANNREADRGKRAQALADYNNLIQALIGEDDFPVVDTPVLQHTLNNLRKMGIHIYLRKVYIPKQVLWELRHTLSTAHFISLLVTKIEILLASTLYISYFFMPILFFSLTLPLQTLPKLEQATAIIAEVYKKGWKTCL